MGARTLTRDGWIVYSTSNPDCQALHKVRVDGSDDTWLVAGIPNVPDVSPDGQAIVFAAADEHDQWGLLIQDFDPERDTSATRRMLLDLGPGTSIESFGLTPDGKSVVASRYESLRSIMLAANVPGVGGKRIQNDCSATKADCERAPSPR